jgi:hypothetical protein
MSDLNEQYFSDLRDLLLQAPEEHLDHQMFPLIEKWESIPTPESVLEVLDHCVFSGLASDFTMMVLNTIYEQTLEVTGKTGVEVTKTADDTWRKSF